MTNARRRAAIVVAIASCLTSLAQAQSNNSPARVLMIFGHDQNAPGVVAFSRGLTGVLRSEYRSLEVYNEALDYDRFENSANWPRFTAYLADKYRGFHFDAIVAEGSSALKFATERLAPVFGGVPIIYGNAFEPMVDFDALPANVTGRRIPVSFAQTFLLARGLQPDAKRVVLVRGASSQDSVLAEQAVRDITPLLDGMQIEVLKGWTYTSLLVALRQLPKEGFVIVSSIRRDWSGQSIVTGDMIPSITTASTIPVYGVTRNWLGDGIVGGTVMDFANDGEYVGKLVLRILKRPAGEPLPSREVASNPTLVDWRQMQRWELSESRLPPGAQVLYRAPSAWSRYRIPILIALAVIAAQAGLIALLVLERRRRMRTEQSLDETAVARAKESLELAESRDHVAHMARVATMGQLGATISHELRQPLTAVRVHAETGTLLLSQDPPDVREAREVFRDIISDNARAMEVIEHVRMLLRKETAASVPVSLNEVCHNAVKLINRDARAKDVLVELCLAERLPAVRGDAVQLQQVVLNLVMNAIESAATSTVERRVFISTAASENGVELAIRDTGPGLSPQAQAHLFESFFSTKKSGLGMGLPIVHQIVEQHHGRVHAENAATGGAVFRVSLPGEGGTGVNVS